MPNDKWKALVVDIAKSLPRVSIRRIAERRCAKSLPRSSKSDEASSGEAKARRFLRGFWQVRTSGSGFIDAEHFGLASTSPDAEV